MHIAEKLGEGSFQIGAVEAAGRAVLAPLSGVTDVVFRRIAKRFGAALVVSEMVASDDYVRGVEEARLRAEGEGIAPHVVQLAGCDPHWIAEAARLAEANGAAIIDINMGCPAKRVTGGYAGSALMRDLPLASRLIETVVGAVRIPVTVKMRLGWDDASLNGAALARRAEALGVSAVAVHGRTRQQFYKGQADWTRIREVAQAVAIPLMANGDVTCVADARRCLDVSGARAVMIGRSAIGRPWLVGQVAAALAGRPAPDLCDMTKNDAALEHYDELLSLFGREVGVRHARKHLAAYADRASAEGYGLSPKERLRLVTTDDPAVAVGLLKRLYLGQTIPRAAA